MEAVQQQTPKDSPLFTNRALARLMIPLVIEQLLLMTVGMADTMMVTSFDAGVDLLVQGSAVAANAIASSIAGVTNVPGQGAGLSMVTVVGQAMGAGDHAQAVGYTKKLMKVSYASMCVMSLRSISAPLTWCPCST